MDKAVNISIIGAGNVATHLARQFVKHPQIHLQQMYNRHIDKLKEFESATEIIGNLSRLKPVDVIIISIKDDVIGDFSKKLSGLDSLIVHTSGSVAMGELQVKRKGVFYPFQTFSRQVKEMDFSAIPILIEAKYKDDLKLLQYVAGLLSENVQVINSQQRLALHIGGVFVSNFVNRLYAEANLILKENNLSFDLLKPLILEVANKVQKLTPATAQTGPAIRNDGQIIQKHLDFLKDEKQKEIYKILTDRIIDTLKK